MLASVLCSDGVFEQSQGVALPPAPCPSQPSIKLMGNSWRFALGPLRVTGIAPVMVLSGYLQVHADGTSYTINILFAKQGRVIEHS